MKLELKFLCTRSGKSLFLKIEDKTYAFNIFEGFQRYCIEKKQSLCSISAMFLTNKFNVPPLMATYLSLLDSNWKSVDVISNFDVNFRSIHKFAYSSERSPVFKNSYSDQYISVKIIDNDSGMSDFIISFTKIRGKFYPERLPPNIPKNLFKNLISDGTLTYENQVFNFCDCSDPDFYLNDVCLVFRDSNFEKLPTNIKCFFCFNLPAYKYLTKQYPELNISLNNSLDNFNGIYLISDNTEIEHEDFYDYQLSLHEKDTRFTLPYSFRPNEIELNESCSLKTGDFLFMKSQTNYC